MRPIDLNTIKKVWKHKLTRNFKKDELFNIYIDSPFCHPPFCRFCIYKPKIIKNKEDLALKDRYYDEIIIKNIQDFSEIISLRKPDVAYFGGGTSSLMTTEHMIKIFKQLHKHCDFKNLEEKHFELNPLSATDEKIKLLIDWNFTHLTFGLQTFNKEVLKFNNRTNVSIQRLKKICSTLEKNDIKYNIDLLAFIYKDHLQEDLGILRSDLDTLKKDIEPRRITIFPNYRKFHNLNTEDKKNEAIRKIHSFRKMVSNFVSDGEYKNIHESSLPLKEYQTMLGLLTNPMLIRKDMLKTRWKNYSSTSPWNNPPINQNVLAIGGYGERKPYSYIPNKFAYNTINDENGRRYELVFADYHFNQS